MENELKLSSSPKPFMKSQRKKRNFQDFDIKEYNAMIKSGKQIDINDDSKIELDSSELQQRRQQHSKTYCVTNHELKPINSFSSSQKSDDDNNEFSFSANRAKFEQLALQNQMLYPPTNTPQKQGNKISRLKQNQNEINMLNCVIANQQKVPLASSKKATTIKVKEIEKEKSSKELKEEKKEKSKEKSKEKEKGKEKEKLKEKERSKEKLKEKEIEKEKEIRFQTVSKKNFDDSTRNDFMTNLNMINKKRAMQTVCIQPHDNQYEFYREIQKDVEKDFYKEKTN